MATEWRTLWRTWAATSRWNWAKAFSEAQENHVPHATNRNRRMTRPTFPWKSLSLDFRHSSTAQDQSAKFIYHSVLFLRIVRGQVFLQPFEELALSIGLAFQPKAHECGNRFAHAGINRLGIPFHLAGNQIGRA